VAPWSRIVFGPPEPWIEPTIASGDVAKREGDHLTYLLWVRQTNAEVGKSFYASSVRLETQLAVQHQSQWRIDFDPRHQQLTVHWLRVVRSGRAIECLQRERMRLIQRETQLDHHVIDGCWTLLAVLDDVRPGDVLEAAYTFETRNPIRPGGCEEIFIVPAQMVVGSFRFSVLSRPARSLAWKASADSPAREESRVAPELNRWSWTGSQLKPREAEPNQPSNYLDCIWIQVSDLAAWSELTARMAAVWECADPKGLAGVEPVSARPERVGEVEVTALIRKIQDEFRYLSVDLETGGWIPAPAAVVARRRYGDCKDLAWLAMVVLRSWGVRVRPILVGNALRRSVAMLLPMSRLFNHAVLEAEIAGKVRWFDLTLRFQGGGFTDMPVGWFGFGLPVDAAADRLSAQPGQYCPSRYLMRETFLIDTHKDSPSCVERRLRTEGWQADRLRSEVASHGSEEFRKVRLTMAEQRFGKARWRGELKWRDDREKNICELVEVFDIDGCIYSSVDDKRALFDVPPNIVVQSFGVPSDKPRRGPWDMPFPLEISHQITAKHRGMGPGLTLKRAWRNSAVTATLEEPRDVGEWSKTVRFVVNADEVPAEKIGEYAADLANFFQATGWRLYLPWKQARPEFPRGFGELPDLRLGAAAYVPSAMLETFPPASEVKDRPPETRFHRLKAQWAGLDPRIVGLLLFLLWGIAQVAIPSCSKGP
jgi:transglutaminase-like putative cysteine protease